MDPWSGIMGPECEPAPPRNLEKSLALSECVPGIGYPASLMETILPHLGDYQKAECAVWVWGGSLHVWSYTNASWAKQPLLSWPRGHLGRGRSLCLLVPWPLLRGLQEKHQCGCSFSYHHAVIPPLSKWGWGRDVSVFGASPHFTVNWA